MDEVVAEVPSNIALLKYWGKRDAALQWPANDSLSMTLSSARTITRASVRRDPAAAHAVLGLAPAATAKALAHVTYLGQRLGFQAALDIATRNTFPTGAGIASSASGMGALTLAALGAWTGAGSMAELAAAGYPAARIADLARAGSGSACRSFFGGFVLWEAGGAADAQSVTQVAAADHWPLADVIVLVATGEKAHSSRDGHRGAWTSPLFAPRLAGLPERLRGLRDALARRDLAALGADLEAEALEMHGVMMSSTPPLHYFAEPTARVLAWVREQRRLGGLAAYFTLDAGPNVHILCAAAEAPELARRLAADFPNLELLLDRTGQGPTLSRRPSL